jgi:hypothetical protein
VIYIAAGFVEEMRIVAMKLHTKDQAPKEGEQKAAEKPFPKVCVILLACHKDVMFSSALRRCTHARCHINLTRAKCSNGDVVGHSGSRRGRAISNFWQSQRRSSTCWKTLSRQPHTLTVRT